MLNFDFESLFYISVKKNIDILISQIYILKVMKRNKTEGGRDKREMATALHGICRDSRLYRSPTRYPRQCMTNLYFQLLIIIE